jgi:Tol biopolymer transport system component
MNKKLFIFLIILIVIGAGIFAWQYSKKISDKKFLSQLKGEIVFTKRDNGVLNIYKINADGTGEKLLYHNEDPMNPNASSPKWSQDGSKIYFTAMKNGQWTTFIMNPDGSQVELVAQGEPILMHPLTSHDLVVQKGSVYWKDEQGELHKVYYFPNQNYKTNPGASEASWSPDKKYIIFDVCSFVKGCRIMIAKKDGSRVVELTKGQQPDWKY